MGDLVENAPGLLWGRLDWLIAGSDCLIWGLIEILLCAEKGGDIGRIICLIGALIGRFV